jgi:Domain of unknown function (DUF397)
MEHTDGLNWRKSSYSGGNGGACVEVASQDGTILVRDSKDHGRGPVHRYTHGQWRALVAGARSGDFDPDESGRLP